MFLYEISWSDLGIRTLNQQIRVRIGGLIWMHEMWIHSEVTSAGFSIQIVCGDPDCKLGQDVGSCAFVDSSMGIATSGPIPNLKGAVVVSPKCPPPHTGYWAYAILVLQHPWHPGSCFKREQSESETTPCSRVRKFCSIPKSSHHSGNPPPHKKTTTTGNFLFVGFPLNQPPKRCTKRTSPTRKQKGNTP